MSLNTIELPDFLVAELYGDLLMASPDLQTAKPLVSPVEGPSSEMIPKSPDPNIPIPGNPEIPKSQNPKISKSSYKFLGNNQKKISILVDSPGSAFLPDDQLGFLTKILEACKMNIGDVAIVNHANVPVQINALKQQLSPSVILLFGVSPVDIQLPIQFPQFKLQSYDQSTYLSSPALQQYVSPTEESKLLKTKLWVTLRTLFEI